MDCIKRVFKNAFDLKGRAPRKEYWLFTLFSIIALFISVVIDINIGSFINIDGKPTFPILYLITYLILLVPSFTLSVRRMHDIGKSGWWILLPIIPLIGPLVFLYFLILPSDEENKYGEPNPC